MLVHIGRLISGLVKVGLAVAAFVALLVIGSPPRQSPQLPASATDLVFVEPVYEACLLANDAYIARGRSDLVVTGDIRGTTSCSYAAGICRLTRSPVDDTVAIGAYSGTVWVQSPEAEVPLALGVLDGIVKALTFSHDGEQLCAASDRRQIVVWNLRTGQERSWHAQANSSGVGFACDNVRLVTRDCDDTLTVWDIGSQSAVMRLPMGDRGGGAAACSPITPRIAWVDRDMGKTRLRVLDFESGQSVWEILLERDALTSYAPSVTFSPDGELLALADGRLLMTVRSATGEILSKRQGHNRLITSISFSTNGAGILSSSLDGGLGLWESTTLQNRWRIETAPKRCVPGPAHHWTDQSSADLPRRSSPADAPTGERGPSSPSITRRGSCCRSIDSRMAAVERNAPVRFPTD